MRYPPSFDGRIVLYPDARSVRDYFAWRQVDSESPLLCPLKLSHPFVSRKAHVNNLYNTVFWALVQQGGKSTTEAHAALKVRPAVILHLAAFTFQPGHGLCHET